MRFLVLFFLLLSTPGFAQTQEVCAWKPVTQKRFMKDNSEIWIFQVPDHQVLESLHTSQGKAYLAMKDFILENTQLTQQGLIERQKSLFARIPEYYSEDVQIMEAVLNGALGTIRKVHCLESLLLNEHMERWPLKEKGPSEYGAFVLAKDGQLLILFSSETDKTVPFHDEIKNEFFAALKQGWKYKYHLHAHPFQFDGSVDIIGTVAPSKPDFNLYVDHFEKYGMTQARVTNGINTFEIQLDKSVTAKISEVRKLPTK